MIDGLEVERLKVVPRAGGELVEVLAPAPGDGTGIRGAHVSTIYPGVIKPWHFHPEARETLVCLTGMLKLVLYDDRESSPTRGELQEVFSGELDYRRVTIPAGLKHAARAYGGERVRVLVLSDGPRDPGSPVKVPVEPPVDYDWSVKIT